MTNLLRMFINRCPFPKRENRLKVLRISPEDTLEIRHRVLRPYLDKKEDCVFPGDDSGQTFHLGGFLDSKLASIASFYFESNPAFEQPYQFRLRGMATLPDYQGKGLSSELLNMGFPIVKQNMCELVWCNARKGAIGFYEKVGFEKVGDFFDIPEIGPHLLMVKYLD